MLAQKVLKGETKGYRNHPQLTRFKAQRDPAGAIARYLRSIYEEAASRGYQFSEDKIGASDASALIACARGQLLYEWNHLKEKLRLRDARKYSELAHIELPEAHPMFRIVEGGVESWEVTGERASPE